MQQTFIQTFSHLKDKPKADRALALLQKIASLVKPIMRKHGWTLPVLAEFFPDQTNLLGLNVNMGQKILVRLRPAHSPDTFFDDEDVVQTMLHELTHNVHGPHDDKFYKYLAGLQDEYDALKRSGYAGEGFFSPGQRLGTNVSHNLPPHMAKSRALDAAQKRQQIAQTLGGGGRRLGGGNPTVVTGLTPRQLAAEAAERRAHDDKACGQGEMAQREADKAAKDSVVNDVIDLTGDDSDDDPDIEFIDPVPVPIAGPSKKPSTRKPPASNSGKAHSTAGSTALPRRTETNASTAPAKAPMVVANSPAEWACQTCTLLNAPSALQCDACLTKRPPPPDAAGWTCVQCGESGMPHDFWSCRFCGTIKRQS